MRKVLYFCQSSKLVPIIANAATKDRNPKLRQYCAQYVQQVSCQDLIVEACCLLCSPIQGQCVHISSAIASSMASCDSCWHNTANLCDHTAMMPRTSSCCWHHNPSCWLPQVIEMWDAELLRRSSEHLDAGIKAATADNSSETRTLGRQAFAMYARKLPDRAEALLRKLDPSLREKLASLAPRTSKPGGGWPMCWALCTDHALHSMPLSSRSWNTAAAL